MKAMVSGTAPSQAALIFRRAVGAPGEVPKVIRLHFVRHQVLAV
jgi:hypothetical protein